MTGLCGEDTTSLLAFRIVDRDAPLAALDKHDEPGDYDREHKDLYPVMEEDLWAWRSCQAGYNSNFSARGPLAPEEEVIKRLQTWLVRKYEAEEARAKA